MVIILVLTMYYYDQLWGHIILCWDIVTLCKDSAEYWVLIITVLFQLFVGIALTWKCVHLKCWINFMSPALSISVCLPHAIFMQSNPIARWHICQSAINSIAFSTDGAYLATVGRDGMMLPKNH